MTSKPQEYMEGRRPGAEREQERTRTMERDRANGADFPRKLIKTLPPSDLFISGTTKGAPPLQHN